MKLIRPKVRCFFPKEEFVVQKLANITAICTNKCTASMELDEMRKYISARVKARHLSILEHVNVTVDITTDRGVSHELVRHRLASYTQKSTRYCAETMEDITFIIPPWLESISDYPITDCTINVDNKPKELTKETECWINALWDCALAYMTFRDKYKWAPEQARSLLPNALATEIVVTANLREWMHIIDLRGIGTTGRPHPQMQQVALAIGVMFYEWCPWLFKNVTPESMQDLADMERIDV